ncbi:threonine ammonia-lyase, biosynthetic [Methylobacterium nodulans]|uniref:L-threonine dehydratase n=1 Tax=Methylobacterium nodulans (strain LMG 21967 / CNCM I-2342 / ORS 2060) TaxID=460265 RepID=B8IL99_METNO|nr:threonine ammonia-lyase, biosynthetic [Methylobacterium nodulans]ACL60098.1 threonine dehydratase, biosynthetic [Methylobacterium nodulans ORS 2060]
MHDYIKKVLTARVYDVAIESPLDRMPRLSGRIGAPVLLKREDLQPVFSFKLRGAYNKMAGLSREALERGVICASAGNHAQGVALAAAKLGARATIVMPRTTPAIKVEAVRARGGNAVLHGDAFDEAYAHAKALEAEQGLTFIHPYDDPEVIAGQGTIGLEILHQHSGPIEAIFVPIGGGGLAAGIAIVVKFLRPETKVIGVEPEDAAGMAAALKAGERVVLNSVGLFADGVAVRQAGAETFRLCREYLDGVVTVGTDAICAAVKDVFDDTRAISEPSGALAVAGLKAWAAENGAGPGGALVAINSGANLNFDRLRHIAERAELGERREVLIAVTIPERRGSYRAFIQALGQRAITEFNYRYAEGPDAHIFVGVQLQGQPGEKRALIASLTEAGYPVLDLSDNEMAKTHVRYMVGGRVPGLTDERLFRFEFPERPGALLKFLDGLGDAWNISLFHYRNHGADYGRILAGIQVPESDRTRFQRALDDLGYPYHDESGNPAYRLFLDGNMSAEAPPPA